MRTPSRILMTCDAVGGVWTYARRLADALAELGVETVLTGFGPRPDGEPLSDRAPTREIVWTNLPLAWMEGPADVRYRVRSELERLACARGIELLHLNQPSDAADPVASLPTIVVSHSCLATWWDAVRGGAPPPDWRQRIACDAAGLSRADAIVAPSASHARAVVAAYGITAPRVVPNAVDPAPVGAVEKDLVVLAAARWWDDGKNAATLDAAAGRSKVPVVMAGPTTFAAQETRLAHATRFGACAHHELRALMAQAAIFCSPSLYEPFGLTALEAAQAGCALVLSDIPTYREIWDGAAMFVPPRDAAGFARAFDALAADPADRRRLGVAAAERVRRFTPEAQARAMLAVYRDALAAAT
ncbi:glycosyltransferase family 4 protein [Alsobacter sp. R-9]